MLNLDMVFQGRLRLKPRDQVPTQEVLEVYARATGQQCQEVFLLSASSARESLPVLQEHCPGIGAGEVLRSQFAEQLTNLFKHEEDLNWYTHVFDQFFVPAATNSIQHVFRDHKGWGDTGDVHGERVFQLVRRAFLDTHYYCLALSFHAMNEKERNAHAQDLAALAQLMANTAIPFALSDNRQTLLCLTA